MQMDPDKVLALFRALAQEGARYKVVGGVALNLHGIVRATEDVDLFIASDDDNVARVKRALKTVFEDPSIDEISAVDLRGEYPAIQFVPEGGGLSIDLLSRLGDAFDFDGIEANEEDVEGIRVMVATPRMLYRMKRDTVRLQDKADAARLRELFDLEDE
jgi:hypothetical protein